MTTSPLGDNSTSSGLLREVIERVEKLIVERDEINSQIKATLDTAEGEGLDKKTIREMIRLRKMDKTERDEREQLRELYLSALGLF